MFFIQEELNATMSEDNQTCSKMSWEHIKSSI